jgi:DNA replication licensing factor MCM2
MCAKNSSSLEVSYLHLGDEVPILAIWLADVPKDMIEIFDEVLEEMVKKQFPYYSQITTKLFVRITDLPISDRLRDLRQGHLNCLVRVSGVITRRSGVFPELLQAVYNCSGCGLMTDPFDAKSKSKPTVCPRGCDMPSFRVNQSASVYGNYQKLTLQESPGSVPPGRVPRYADMMCFIVIEIRALHHTSHLTVPCKTYYLKFL